MILIVHSRIWSWPIWCDQNFLRIVKASLSCSKKLENSFSFLWMNCRRATTQNLRPIKLPGKWRMAGHFDWLVADLWDPAGILQWVTQLSVSMTVTLTMPWSCVRHLGIAIFLNYDHLLTLADVTSPLLVLPELFKCHQIRGAVFDNKWRRFFGRIGHAATAIIAFKACYHISVERYRQSGATACGRIYRVSIISLFEPENIFGIVCINNFTAMKFLRW